MDLSSLSITIGRHDEPKYYHPADFNPNGWFSLGHMVTLGMPNDPQAAMEYLLALRQCIDEARALISGTQLAAICDVVNNH